MKKLFALVSVAVVGLFMLTAASVAMTPQHVWQAALLSGQEVPKQVVKNTAAHGRFKGILTGSKLKWKLTYVKLSGPAIAAHIHMAAKGKSGNVIVPLCGAKPACKSGMTGTITVTAKLKRWFKQHLLYVNVHTAKNPNGEIRGQLAPG